MKDRKFEFMEQKAIFRVLSLVGLVLGGIGTLLSSWADDKEQDAIIEGKANEALITHEHGTSGSEEPWSGFFTLAGVGFHE